jgi:hypothetical protein
MQHPERMKVRGYKEIKEIRSLPGGCGPVGRSTGGNDLVAVRG